MSRYFVALDFSTDSKELILTLSQNILSNLSLDKGKLKLTKKQNLHATLEFFGLLNEEKLKLWRTKIKNFDQNFIAQNKYLNLNTLGYFSKKELVIWLGSTEFECFRRLLKLPENFVFHITIARYKNYSAAILRSLEALSQQRRFMEKVELKSIALWRSELKSQGPQYFEEEILLTFI